MKRKIDKHYIVLASVVVLITLTAVIMSYQDRGYFAVGGEIFIVPLIFLIRLTVQEFKNLIKEVK
ncbi:hypothetical protein ABGF26_02765 [Helcococcus ovis]|uniref:hypothetical protein n=1 Tax=Helcococcus ovis TaxID=72026 RepID=UPI0038B980E2